MNENFKIPKKKNLYFEKHRNREVRPFVEHAVSFCSKRDWALDLGAGTLRESKFLLENGFENVTAVERSSEAKNIQKEDGLEKLDLQIKSFKDFEFPKDKYDLINAQFSLPFYDGENFSQFIQDVIDSLKPNGIFVGQLFGNNDDRYWGSGVNIKASYFSKEEIGNMFYDLEKIEFKEIEKDISISFERIKHWHIFNFIFRKKD